MKSARLSSALGSRQNVAMLVTSSAKPRPRSATNEWPLKEMAHVVHLVGVQVM
jgi:hypothetical protein